MEIVAPPSATQARMSMPEDRTIINVFEDVPGLPFDPNWTKEIPIDVPTTRKLAQAVDGFYRNFNFPEKDDGSIRPYIFFRYTEGQKPYQGRRRPQSARWAGG